HGSPCHTNDRGGSAATDYTQGRLTMQPGDHTPNYTSLTDVTSLKREETQIKPGGPSKSGTLLREIH
ncbi:MAG: hypothetical protein ACOY4P_17785, partial [Pseudomonadota bacterium]